ncbi:hypothetical protein [Zavarzinia aquatilis]|uniref:DUF927 domain-containing protein n=1 Tax=Zavarzinia aquatilis TaxID=2211142 RepID=A0A317EDZ0_9PROT|nr:hypothetical protein [Zavarzinia aquatilis]PWR24971.1 hypothetical protein DKG74_04170 [Zavarzinia aquatilis]
MLDDRGKIGPVTPLGVLGDTAYYLDACGQLRDVKSSEHGRLKILSLFGVHTQFLYEAWPRKNKDGDIVGWRPELAAETLMPAAAARGVWDPLSCLRGRGAWLGPDGELLLHCGDAILVNGLWHRPSMIGPYVYSTAAPVPRPAEGVPPPSGFDGPAEAVMRALKTWEWKRPDVDPWLLLGWIGCGMIGGVLPWRPVAWITGDASTGKSTLQRLIAWLLGGSAGLVSVADASAAGIWQELGHATLPVAIDEIEAEADNRKVDAVVKLARLAASGGMILRGGAEHTSSKFIARSCFLFSSILLPPLLPQDRSRMAILELDPLTGSTPPPITERVMGEIGRGLRRRLVDQWPRFAQTLELFRQAMAANGHGGRGADVFGTLLAVADLLLHDDLPDSDYLAEWGYRLRTATLAERDGADRDHENCLGRITSYVADVYRVGIKQSVGTWIANAAWPSRLGKEAELMGSGKEAERVLAAYGLRIIAQEVEQPEGGRKQSQLYLAVANKGDTIDQIFAGTHWAARSGTQGVWVQALRRTPGAIVPEGPQRIGGVPVRVTLIPLTAIWPCGRPPDTELRSLDGDGMGDGASPRRSEDVHVPL